MKKVLLISAALAAPIGPSAAADLARPVYRPPVIVAAPPVSDWSGVYVGLEGGYGWAKQSTDAISPGDQFSAAVIAGGQTDVLTPAPFYPNVAVLSVKQRGWLFGGFFGAQKQWGNWVLGIEGSIDGAAIKGSETATASSVVPGTLIFSAPPGVGGGIIFNCPTSCLSLAHTVSVDTKVDALASLRGKVGWSFAPHWLIYGTGGAAFAHVENTVISTSSFNFTTDCLQFSTCVFPSGSLNTSGGTTLLGWALGGGVDWKRPLDAGSALVFGVEYLHYGFPEQTITLSDNAGASFAFRAKESVDTIKARISYLFSVH